jgi:hypothetical protein
MANELTVELLQEMMNKLPKRQPRKMALVQIDDLLSFFRELRKAGFRWKRQKSNGIKMPIYNIYPEDRPFDVSEVFVDTLRIGTRGRIVMIDEPEWPLQRKIKIELDYAPYTPGYFGLAFGFGNIPRSLLFPDNSA